MTTKNILILSLILAALFFAMGRYSVSQTNTDKKTDEIKDTNTHKQETITEVKKPDGTVTTVTQINVTRETTDKKDSEVITKVALHPKLNISGLVAASVHSPLSLPLYGVSVNKEVLGPITMGLFGLTNGALGISIGMDF